MGKLAILSLPARSADVRVRYGDDTFQFADLRLPKSSGSHPVVVVIHGGFWRAQYGLDHIGRMCEAITSRGYATYSIEYRRIGNPGGGFPGTFLDIGNAVDDLRNSASTYGLDFARVVSIGHSAGGHLAMWLAGRHKLQGQREVTAPNPLRLTGAISLAGVLDLKRASEQHLGSNATDELVGGSPEMQPARYRVCSPREMLPLGVPQFLIHGEEDDTVPVDISSRYYEAALALGDPVTLATLPHVGHFELIDPEDDAFTMVQQTIERAFTLPARK